MTEQELEIMKVVWGLKRATVRDVYETLRERRKIAYTTVMTMMNILEAKKHLKKRAQDRAYVYQATRPRSQVIKAMVREFVERVFNGSAEPLLVHLIKDRQLSQKDLQKIARTIEEAE
ncbi:MAG TPA: BlaI/MecI/CopY family transcriptional regulator [Terriglobia bacterium]|nr:BlaI/MecI/CopY family transcriptional regulator [Terriglobia bacterium]